MVRIFMSGFIVLLTVAAVSFIVYGLIVFIGMESNMMEWQPITRFWLVALSLFFGGFGGVGIAEWYLDLTKEPKGIMLNATETYKQRLIARINKLIEQEGENY